MLRTTTAWLLGLVLLCGCITATTTLEPNGSGTMTLSYALPKESNADKERKRAAGPHVTVEKAEVEGSRVTLRLKFDDVRKLDTSRLFEDFHVTLDDKEEGRRVLVAKFPNPKPITLPDPALERLGREVRITVAVPGEVSESNGKTTDPKTVAWVMPTNDFFGTPQRELRVTYKQPPAEKAPETPPPAGKSEKPPETPPPAGK
jgi:hypothetical protein